VNAYHKGCKFDGWSDRFRYHLWEAAFAETEIDPNFYTTRPRDICEPLPWDHINTQVSKTYLADEWENALTASYTGDCRVEACNQCGVCDFEQIEPRTHDVFENHAMTALGSKNTKPLRFNRISVFYAKQGQSRYFGHLELVNIFLRALKRAGIPLKFSQGFHPKPKVSFDDPLPVGIESEQEGFMITVPDDIRPQVVKDGLNTHLPAGLEITHCELSLDKKPAAEPKLIRYRIALKEGRFDEAKLTAFNNMPEVGITLTNRKGKLKKIDLKDIVIESKLLDSRHLTLTLRSEPGKTLRPFEVLRHIFNLSEAQVKQATIIKLRA